MSLFIERGTTFSSTGIYPLIAGYDNDGDPVYIGYTTISYDCPVCNDSQGGWILFVTAEGIRPEDLHIELECCQQKALLVPSFVIMECLRYAPSVYPYNSKGLGINRKKSKIKGPFSWIPVRSRPKHLSSQRPTFRRVISAEEAASLGVPVFDDFGQLMTPNSHSDTCNADASGEGRSEDCTHGVDEENLELSICGNEESKAETDTLGQVARSELYNEGFDTSSDEGDFVSFVEEADESGIESDNEGHLGVVSRQIETYSDMPICDGGFDMVHFNEMFELATASDKTGQLDVPEMDRSG